QYATYEELALAPTFERKELSHSLWYLRQDLDEKGADYLTTIGQHYTGNGFNEATTEIAALLEQMESRKVLTEELRAFAQAYEQDRSLLRFHFHNPLSILKRMDELELPRQAFESVIPEIPQEQSFITQDEIDGTLVSRYAYSEGNLRIHAFFQSNHTQAEKVAFIKNQYGIGGCSHALSGASGSWMDYDGKGLRLRKNGCEDVSLQWNTVVKRIDDLIAHGRYLSKADLQKIDAERKAEPTVAIAAQESVEETVASTQETSSTDTPDEMSEFFAIDTEKVREGLAARGIVGGMLVDPEKLANDPLIQMVEEDAERIAAVNSAPYAVGDTLYLEDGKPFIVEHVGDLDV
ncbi:MAG: hypothetical protein RR975_15000, partial [Clostridia bacterium]